MNKLYRLEMPKAVCGVVVIDKKVTMAAPYIRFVIGLTEDELMKLVNRRRWRIREVERAR